MTFIKNASRHLASGSALLATITLVGCISADPLPDRNQTARLTDGRTGSDLQLEEAWKQSYDTPSDAWNGIDALTIETAITVTLQNDPGLRLELAKVAEVRADLAQASLPPNPVIGFAVGAPIDGGGGAPAMIELMQQLSWLWTMDDQIDLQDERLAATILAAAQRTVDRATEVRTAFARALAARDLINIETDYIQTTSATFDLVNALARVGELPPVDVDRALIDHRSAEADRTDAIRELRNRKFELLRLMGWPDQNTEWVLNGALEDAQIKIIPEEDETIERALTVRLDIAASQRRIDSAEAEARLAGLSRIPEVTVGLGWKRNFGNREALNPGAMITVPILDDGYARIAKAAARLEAAHLASVIVVENVIEEVRLALNQWLQAREQVEAYDIGLVGSARTVVRRSESAFKAGAVNATELLLTQRRLISLERRLLEERLDADIAWIKLENAVGGSFELPLETPHVQVEKNS